jgi:biopolymer transport protein ExbB/TolQ
MVDLTDVIITLGQFGLWLKAIGVVILLWMIFQFVNFMINRKRIKELYKIKEDMKRIENKIDRILKKKK